MTLVKGATSLLFLLPIAQAWGDHARLLGRSLSHARRAEAANLPQGWISQGCYVDEQKARLFSGANYTSTSAMTVNSCVAFCNGKQMKYAGVESGSECYCDITFSQVATNASMSDCNMACTGDKAQTCGAGHRINVYRKTDVPGVEDRLVPAPTPTSGTTAAQVLAGPVTSGLPGTWQYNGCYVDNANGRVFVLGLGGSSSNTVNDCVQRCSAQGFSVAGTEFANECFCGNYLQNGAALVADTTCNMPCAGNADQSCGGASRVSVYSTGRNVTVYAVPAAQTTNLPGRWQYQGCLSEGANGQRIFPNQIILPLNNSATNCLGLCSSYGYPAGGMEYSNECYCGDQVDVRNNGGVISTPASCNMACSGDPTALCGGPSRIQLYYWDGPNGAIDVWSRPAVTGRYEYFSPGIVVPLIATVGINNKVTFLEKTGTSTFDNSTGGYELDLSIVNQFNRAWREMHPKTDVFCAGSIILPDKAGRQLNVGGWALDSTFGIRLYTPDGSPGVNGTNDWEENFNVLALQKGRWYPTVLLMQNSSVLVMGGQTGSNGPPQPTLEILPQPAGGPTWLHLDWLDTPFQEFQDLYPFLYVLPNGNIFAAYWHQARILDKTTFRTVKVLPDMPSSVISVNNNMGGRTYPLEGASVLFPQRAPYTDPITVLICGGSNPGAGHAIDNCVSIQPDAASPTWVLERMPSKRVMSCMVTLPDGTFLIVNGARQGLAGFGLATDPNLSAVLYDPFKPVRQRMSILGNTTITRFYHSEATLLPDGRVLISGSDPQDIRFPEEMRLEVYIPPYLASGQRQPEFTLAGRDFAFGARMTISGIRLFQGPVSGVRISLIAATSSTHGNTMGGRTIFPAISCSGTTCTVTAPTLAVTPPGWHMLFVLDGPTPSKAVWVRIGGDPARIGNWPALPGFDPPGL